MNTPTNLAKVASASQHPARPGELCKAAPGAYAPIVNRGDCEGKRDCVEWFYQINPC